MLYIFCKEGLESRKCVCGSAFLFSHFSICKHNLHMHFHLHLLLHLHLHLHLHLYLYVYLHMYLHMYLHLYLHMYLYVFTKRQHGEVARVSASAFLLPRCFHKANSNAQASKPM